MTGIDTLKSRLDAEMATIVDIARQAVKDALGDGFDKVIPEYIGEVCAGYIDDLVEQASSAEWTFYVNKGVPTIRLSLFPFEDQGYVDFALSDWTKEPSTSKSEITAAIDAIEHVLPLLRQRQQEL